MTKEYIESYDFEKPLFLKSSFHRPHSPYDPPQRLIDQINPDLMQDVVYGNNWDDKFRNASDCVGQKGTNDTWCGEFNEEDVTTSRRYYHANINFVDEQIGVILQSLEDRGVMNNTIFLFTSDHGDMQSDHYLWRKSLPYEGSTHVPMIISWPESLE